MQIRVTENGETTEIVYFVNPDHDVPLFRHNDVEGDLAVVFPSHDLEQGPGVYIRTTHAGCSIPAEKLEEFFEACREAVKLAQSSA